MRRQALGLLAVGSIGMLLPASPLLAANRIFINNQNLAVSSTGNQIPILADIDQHTYAFSIHIRFEQAKVRITNVALGSHASAIVPEYSQGTPTPNNTGDLVYGVVFDMSDPITKRLTGPATAREILVLTVDVLAAAPTSTVLSFQNDTAPPWRRNVLSDANGESVAPLTLVNGTLTISSLAPVIQSYLSNSGEPGQGFFIVGQNFNQPGLTVEIGGRAPPSFSLLGDNQTIQVTAPGCAGTGFATVEVCTNFGCDSDPQGFNYTGGCDPANLPPIIDSFLSNSGEEGQVFFVVGMNFTAPGLRAEVGGRTARIVRVVDDMTVQVEAPACSGTGLVEVELCNDFGCDNDPQGFEYTACEPGGVGPFIRGDCNGDRQVSGTVTDAVAMLNFNFIGGNTPPCFAACDANRDGAFQGVVTDAVYLLNFNFLGGPPPLAPYPGCDLSSEDTDINLGCASAEGCE